MEQNLIIDLSLEEMQSIDGGCCAFWDMFWSGCKVGLATGGGAAAAYYCMS